MAAKDRVKKHRQKVLQNGGKTLSVLIDRQTVARLDALKSQSGESQAALVTRAIDQLFAAIQSRMAEPDSQPNSDELLMKIILEQ